MTTQIITEVSGMLPSSATLVCYFFIFSLHRFLCTTVVFNSYSPLKTESLAVRILDLMHSADGLIQKVTQIAISYHS